MPNEPEANRESQTGSGHFLNEPLTRKADEQFVTLRERVAFFKEQARLLLKRFERREISQIEAIAEAERLGREVSEAERLVKQWEAQCQRES